MGQPLSHVLHYGGTMKTKRGRSTRARPNSSKRSTPPINTAASARCCRAQRTGELFQQFARTVEKPLKRLTPHLAIFTGLKPRCK